MVACAECGGDLALEAGTLAKGTIVICPACGAEMQVRRVSPLALQALGEDGDEDEDAAG